MADAIFSVLLVLERLRDLFVERAVFNLLSGIRGEIDGTMTELEPMKYFLKDAETHVRNGEKDVSDLVSEIEDTAFSIDDLLSRLTFNLPSKRFIKRLVWFLNQKYKLEKVRSELDNLRTKIAHLKLDLLKLGIKELRSLDDPIFCRKLQLCQSPLNSDLVGFEKNYDQLVAQLTKKDDSLPSLVVSVYGVGGIGKTTLAKKVYQDFQVRRHFDSFAWITLSQDFQVKHVLREVLSQLNSEESEKISDVSNSDIGNILKEKRYLIILDDVCSTKGWDDLKRVLAMDQTCHSKILITTRNKDLALDGFLHELQPLEPLDEDESFKLFQKKACDLTNSKLDEKMNELAKEMLNHCFGLPLAISLLTGLISTRSSIDEWTKLCEDSKMYVKRYNKHEQEYSIDLDPSWLLNLCYDDLPSYLKPCLLYFCLFPKGHEIKVNQLCQLWIAEGFVSLSPWQRGNSFETMEDVAYGCLCELAHRCMIQVEDWGSTGRIRTCRIHDLIRDFCMSKASNESFLQSIIFSEVKNVLQINRFQRLLVDVDCRANPTLTIDNNLKYAHLRSLTCTNLSQLQLKQVWKPLLYNSHLLRVLKLENLKKLVQLPKSVGKLKDLRFFSIKHSDVEQVPSSIGYLRYLQTLDLRTTSRLTLPNVMYKLKELRHLYLPSKTTITDKNLILNGLSSLQTLTNFSVNYCHWNKLARLTNLRRLKIYVEKNLGESYHPTRVTFNRLEFLAVKNSGSTLDIVPITLRYPRTYEIHMGLPIERLPQEDQISPNLIKLTLAHTCLKDDPMATLQKLPNLRTLHLDHNAFLGFGMVCSRGGFPRLESLSLVELLYLEEWQVEEEALPSLSYLSIKCCQRLMTIPDGLKYVTTLQKLVIQKMPIEFKNRVGEGGVDFYKVKHVPSLLFLNTSESYSQGNLEIGRQEKSNSTMETEEQMRIMPNKKDSDPGGGYLQSSYGPQLGDSIPRCSSGD